MPPLNLICKDRRSQSNNRGEPLYNLNDYDYRSISRPDKMFLPILNSSASSPKVAVPYKKYEIHSGVKNSAAEHIIVPLNKTAFYNVCKYKNGDSLSLSSAKLSKEKEDCLRSVDATANNDKFITYAPAIPYLQNNSETNARSFNSFIKYNNDTPAKVSDLTVSNIAIRSLSTSNCDNVKKSRTANKSLLSGSLCESGCFNFGSSSIENCNLTMDDLNDNKMAGYSVNKPSSKATFANIKHEKMDFIPIGLRSLPTNNISLNHSLRNFSNETTEYILTKDSPAPVEVSVKRDFNNYKTVEYKSLLTSLTSFTTESLIENKKKFPNPQRIATQRELPKPLEKFKPCRGTELSMMGKFRNTEEKIYYHTGVFLVNNCRNDQQQNANETLEIKTEDIENNAATKKLNINSMSLSESLPIEKCRDYKLETGRIVKKQKNPDTEISSSLIGLMNASKSQLSLETMDNDNIQGIWSCCGSEEKNSLGCCVKVRKPFSLASSLSDIQ